MAFQSLAWAKCATRMALKPFLLSCMHNLCEFGGQKRALCESLQAFEAACQAQGLKPPVWRNSSFCRECPLCLPPNSSQTLFLSVDPLKLPCSLFLLFATYV